MELKSIIQDYESNKMDSGEEMDLGDDDSQLNSLSVDKDDEQP